MLVRSLVPFLKTFDYSQNSLNFSDAIRIFLFNYSIDLPDNYLVIPVPGDGHCILYSWEIAMSASLVSKIKPSYLALLDMTRMEFMTNRDNYTAYFYDGADITTEVEKFIKENI